MRACMYARVCVGAWVRSHFAEVSKIAQDAARAGRFANQNKIYKRREIYRQ